MLILPEEPKSILIVKLSSIGDVIYSLPVASALRRRFPTAKITWLVSQKAREIVSGHPHLDHLIVVRGNGQNGETPVPDIGHPFQAARILRSIGFDIALDLQGLLRSSLFSYLSGARIRVGYRSLKEAAFLFCNVRAISPARDKHVVDTYLHFADLLGAPISPVEFCIATSEQHEMRVSELLHQAGVSNKDKLMVITPASSWQSKMWPPERLGIVANYVAERYGYLPILAGAKTDIARAEAVIANCKASIVNLCGKTSLKELAVLLRRCNALVGNDSGPTHLAAALGVPVVAIFGPTDATRLGPYGDQHITLVNQMACRPCHRRSKAESCPHKKCITEITPAQVCEAIDVLLSRASKISPSGANPGLIT